MEKNDRGFENRTLKRIRKKELWNKTKRTFRI